ncbi:MAG TPA: indole-3-glycerol phosphate synthase TrpC [Actinomycetota bacterium]|nr:indole-3-glycerol phosphate synthase TrpC [Actinomycetota bacterium]
MGFLTDLVARVRRDLERAPLDEGALYARCMSLPPARDFAGALRGAPGTAVIAEVKRSSPSAGAIAEVDPRALAATYERAGAAAISVLTEPRHFGGSLADLRSVHLVTRIPVLRKDFLVHPAQLMEARAGGADAALLIADAVSPAELRALVQTADDLGLAALVEAHGADHLAAAVETGATVIGVNARDLETLEMDPEQALDLLTTIPDDRVRVFESGIRTREQVERVAAAGANAVLVGESLMRADDPAAALRALLGAGQP